MDESRRDAELEKRDEMVSLLKHPGWVRYVEMLDAQLNFRRVQCLTQCEVQDDAWRREFVKGEYAGLLLAKAWPDMVVKGANEAAALLEKRAEKKGKSHDNS